jgi:hypothetical protein
MQEHMRDLRFNPEVRIHKESYILIKELTKNQVSLNIFLFQEVTKTDLELLTIIKMGNTNLPRLTTQSGSSWATSNCVGAELQE